MRGNASPLDDNVFRWRNERDPAVCEELERAIRTRVQAIVTPLMHPMVRTSGGSLRVAYLQVLVEHLRHRHPPPRVGFAEYLIGHVLPALNRQIEQALVKHGPERLPALLARQATAAGLSAEDCASLERAARRKVWWVSPEERRDDLVEATFRRFFQAFDPSKPIPYWIRQIEAFADQERTDDERRHRRRSARIDDDAMIEAAPAPGQDAGRRVDLDRVHRWFLAEELERRGLDDAEQRVLLRWYRAVCDDEDAVWRRLAVDEGLAESVTHASRLRHAALEKLRRRLKEAES